MIQLHLLCLLDILQINMEWGSLFPLFQFETEHIYQGWKASQIKIAKAGEKKLANHFLVVPAIMWEFAQNCQPM